MIRPAAGGLLLCLLSTGFAGSALAADSVVTLPDFTGIASCVGDGTVVNGSPCSKGGAVASFVGAPFAAAEAYASNGVVYSPGANSALTYYFTIDGPDNGPIDVEISSDLVTRAGYADTAFASVSTSQGSYACADTNEGLCGRGEFHDSLHELDEPGQVYYVHLEAVATENAAFGGSAFASADPLIFIDPDDVDASAYSIRLSAGVVNGLPSGVPEPAAWVIVLVGFAGLGAMVRTRGMRVIAAPGTV